MYICSEIQGQSTIVPVFLLTFFLQIRAQGLATRPNPIFSKLITSLLGHCLLYCNCLRLGLAGANRFHLFCEAKTEFSLCTLHLWQAKADERPRSGTTLMLPRESGPKSKVAVASWRSSEEEALETKPSHSSSDELIQLERQEIQQNKTSMHSCLKMEPLGS